MAEGRVAFEGYMNRLFTEPYRGGRGELVVGFGVEDLAELCGEVVPMKHKMVRVTVEVLDD